MVFRFKSVALLLLLSSAAGCQTTQPPIRVYGSGVDIERLAGRWVGDYRGEPGHPRGGSIAFSLSAATHEAAGDVLMTPENASPYERYYGDDESRRGVEARVAPVQVLTIRFADIGRQTVSGRLDNFWDPDRRTGAYSVFTGRVGDDVIEGTYVTVYLNGDPNTTGRWKVRRVRGSDRD